MEELLMKYLAEFIAQSIDRDVQDGVERMGP